MTVFYVDPLNGNDSNDGTSFAFRRKTLLNYSSVTDEDEIRVIETTPTSLGNGTWTANAGTNTKPTDSSRTIASVSITKANDSNPVSCSKTAHGLITGDIILRTPTGFYGFYAVTKVDDDNFTLDGTESQATHSVTGQTIYKVSEFCVKLASSPIKNILCSGGLSSTHGSTGTGTSKPWTAVQGTTGQELTLYRTQRYAARYFRPGNDATGKVAYCELDSTLDLSGYQQISLKFAFDYIASGQRNDSGIFSLRLCSDTQGDTVVNTIPISPCPGDDQDMFYWWTYDNGANLGSNINSVALYVDIETEHANTEIILSNIIACKAKSAADSLHLGSLISKGTTNTSNYYGISAIIDNIVILKLNGELANNNAVSTNLSTNYTNNLRHNETTGTVTTYKVDPFTPDPTFYHSGEDYQPNIINIDDNSCTISGGWNSTDMSTQTTNAMSWLSQFQGMYKSIAILQTGSISNIGEVNGLVRYEARENNGRNVNATISNCHFINQRFFYISRQGVKVENCKISGHWIHTQYHYGSGGTLFVNCNFLNTAYYSENTDTNYFTGCTFNGSYGTILLYESSDTNIYPERLFDVEYANCTFKNLTLGDEDWQNRYRSLVNCSLDNFTLFLSPDYDRGVANDKLPAFSFINYNNTANDHRFYYINGLVVSDSSVTQSGSGYSWKFTTLQAVNSVQSRQADPIQFKLAEVAVVANAQVTASAYFRRTWTSGTGNDVSGLALLTIPNLNLGITSDVKVLTDAAADTWQQVTLTFTPTVSGIATFHALLQMTATAQNVYVDSFSVTQA